VRNSGAPSLGDIVEVKHATKRMGLVVDVRGIQIGIRYFKPSAIKGTPTDFVWWIHRTHVKIISSANQKTQV